MAEKFVTMKHKQSGAVISGVHPDAVPAHKEIGYVVVPEVPEMPEVKEISPAAATVRAAHTGGTPVRDGKVKIAAGKAAAAAKGKK